MPGCCGDSGPKRYLTDDEKAAIKWEARPILYLTLFLDPKYIPTRKAMLERLDAELVAMRNCAIDAWDGITEHAG